MHNRQAFGHSRMVVYHIYTIIVNPPIMKYILQQFNYFLVTDRAEGSGVYYSFPDCASARDSEDMGLCPSCITTME